MTWSSICTRKWTRCFSQRDVESNFGGVQVRYSTPLMKIVDYDDEENWFRCHDDDGADDDETPVYLHSGKLQIQNGEQLSDKMAEARQLILERNSGSIRGKSNLVIESIGDVCFKVVNNANKIQ